MERETDRQTDINRDRDRERLAEKNISNNKYFQGTETNKKIEKLLCVIQDGTLP